MKKYVKSDSEDFSTIQWKSQPCTISGLNQPSMYYTKDLGNGYYATVKPEYRKKIDMVVWVASIYEVNRLCGFESFETAYDAKDWVDYESYDLCIKSVTATTSIVCDTSSEDELQTALDYINQYCWREFDEDAPELTKSDDLSAIGIMYTTADETDDNYKQLQVTVDLINPAIRYYVTDYDGKEQLVGEEKFNNLRDLIDNELSMEYGFQEYYERCIGYGRDAGLIDD